MSWRLTYFSGSPFARMCRILILEWHLPVEPVEHSFPPGPEMYAINPLGQVPALVGEDGRAAFPTFLVLEALWEMAGRPPAYQPQTERQVLMTILQAGDAMATACYQKWSGLRPVGPNALGFDLGERQMGRVASTLDWLESGARIRPGLTVPGVALACLCLWADAREGLDWRRCKGLAALVEELAARESFRATPPRRWSPE